VRAVVVEAYGEPVRVREVPEPTCPVDGVVVAVAATGVCRSDWHAWHGHDPVPLPQVLGHEWAGTVLQVGAQVSGWAPGDRVTAPFVQGCGSCAWCREGQAQVCPDQSQPGFTTAGSFAGQVVVRAAGTNLVRVPDGVELVAAAALGCRFATAFRAVSVHAAARAGQWVAVHGCGGVGLSAVQVAVALGARVVAVDVQPAALERARSMGAEVTLTAGPDGVAGEREVGHDVAREDVAAAVREVTGGGAHASLDALGSPATAAASVRSLRRRGRHVQVGLLLGADAGAPLPLDLLVSHELSVHGSHGMAAVDYPAMVDLVASGALRPELLVGKVTGLDGAAAALAAMDRPSAGAGVTVLVPGLA
jgi:D-arabinose 1-dehydrogenase-like Zn-dependent alcohol dehydrogenase